MAESTGARPRRTRAVRPLPIDLDRQRSLVDTADRQFTTMLGNDGRHRLGVFDPASAILGEPLDAWLRRQQLSPAEFAMHAYVSLGLVQRARKEQRVGWSGTLLLLAAMVRLDPSVGDRLIRRKVTDDATTVVESWDLWKKETDRIGEVFDAEEMGKLRGLAVRWVTNELVDLPRCAEVDPVRAYLTRTMGPWRSRHGISHLVHCRQMIALTLRFLRFNDPVPYKGEKDVEFAAELKRCGFAPTRPSLRLLWNRLYPANAAEVAQATEVVGHPVTPKREPKPANPAAPAVSLTTVDGALAALPAHVLPHSRVALTLVPVGAKE